jgi:hypothetical protein
VSDATIEALQAQLKTVLDREAEAYRRRDAKLAAIEAQLEQHGAILRAAGDLRDAADRVSEWFCVEARHLEGPRIQALRAAMVAYDALMQPAPGGPAP